ncbi:MAG: HesA/MoeB/ThiF family protein [Flavobacteriales bacterium]|nr:HesA/MoeB/ThiF family protein [Flavobacteriales bacterium]
MRYSRQTTLPEVGTQGQKRLADARVLMVGAGGLGCPALLYLAAAGVGTIGIIDGDVVDVTNLQRQVLYSPADVGRMKAEAAQERLSGLNPDIRIIPFTENLTPANALDILGGFDLVIDGTDNFATRYLLNDACVKLGIPFIYGAIHRFEGQVSVFNYNGGPTYRCLFPDPPAQGQIPNCAEAGVLGVLPGIIGTLQATEALKVLLAIGRPLSGRLWVTDLLTNSAQTISFGRDDAQVTKAMDIDLTDSFPTSFCSSDQTISPAGFVARLAAGDEFNVLDVREYHETPRPDLADLTCIPLGQLADRMDQLPTDRPLLVCCQHGPRSLQAIAILKELGFPQELINLKGGMAALHKQLTDT